MDTRYGNHDTDDTPDTQDSPHLDLVPHDHPILVRDNDSSYEYCEEDDACHPLADLPELFQQLKEPICKLKIYHSPIHTHIKPVTTHRYTTAPHYGTPNQPPI